MSNANNRRRKLSHNEFCAAYMITSRTGRLYGRSMLIDSVVRSATCRALGIRYAEAASVIDAPGFMRGYAGYTPAGVAEAVWGKVLTARAAAKPEPDPVCDGCGTYAWVFGDDRPAVGDDCPDGDCCGTIQPADPEPDPVCDACGGPVVADDALCFACADDEDAKFVGGWTLGDD